MTPSVQPHLASLLTRVEGLTGPDREVDALLLNAVGDQALFRGPKIGWESREDGKGVWRSMPNITASLDAVLALVERVLRPLHPGMTLTLKAIYSGSREPYWYAEITWPSSERQGRATTPAIALLGALLRSLEQ